ncbi:hypothetical protein [Paraclostridium sordellii]|uniref:Uncharacterized protein n=1 Tax=Paraclostridium sordellii TaxID=1505 RepID=A0A9P1KYV0_PARSO|nr:hypothetical protein [Paeniclostridium sordellii]CEO32696.1 Uncharacterised protein [[Clostridium] sordellii] [Paeniclostridium sordellii]
MEELIDGVKYICKEARLQVTSVVFNLYNIFNLKTKMRVRRVLFICLFPLTAMLMKGNIIDKIYLKNPLAMLGVVTGGITALITMLIFIINFNVNDIYLGRSKSKAYLDDRVLIKFFKSITFKFIYFIFLLVTIKLCGIVFKETYIYKLLEYNKLFSNLLYITEKYYINVGIFSFIILSLTILLAIMGNIEQLFNTMKFKENEMLYLKRKIEESIVEKYKNLLDYRKDGKYFLGELTGEYDKIKEDEKEKFLQIVFKGIINTDINIYTDFFINEMTIQKLNDFLNNKYNWMKENVSNKDILEKSLIEDILALSYLEKSKFNNLKVYYEYEINCFGEKQKDIRLNLIYKFINLENQRSWKFFHSLIEKIIESNRLSADIEFIKSIFKKTITVFLNIDDLEKNILYKLLKQNIYNKNLEKLKNEVIILYLYDQDINNLEKSKYKKLLNLLSEEYKISWALYKILEKKHEWSKNVEFAFEVLYEICLKSNEELEMILSILDKSRLNHRMRDKYEFIFANLKEDVNYEFEEILRNRDINIFKFILIRDWIYKNYRNYYTMELKYFNENIDNRILINNIFNKLLLYINYRVIEQNTYITEIIYLLIKKYRNLILKSIYRIADWKTLLYLDIEIDGVLEVHFKTNHKRIKNDLTLAYFNVLLDKKRYKELYLDEIFKKELYISLSGYMRRNDRTLEETINKFKEYRNLSELEERALKQEIDYLLIIQ